MSSFYDITTKIRDTLEEDPSVNKVVYGKPDEEMLNKMQLYGICMFWINTFTITGTAVKTYNISLIAMDTVDINSEEDKGFYGNDNSHDVWNTQEAVLDRFFARMDRGDLATDGYQLNGVATPEKFYDRYEDLVAGWAVIFNVDTKNDMTICD